MEITDKVLEGLVKLEDYKDEFLKRIKPNDTQEERERLWQTQLGHRNLALYIFNKYPEKISKAEIVTQKYGKSKQMIYPVGIGEAIGNWTPKPALFYFSILPTDKEGIKHLYEEENMHGLVNLVFMYNLLEYHPINNGKQ